MNPFVEGGIAFIQKEDQRHGVSAELGFRMPGGIEFSALDATREVVLFRLADAHTVGSDLLEPDVFRVKLKQGTPYARELPEGVLEDLAIGGSSQGIRR